jgi:hypothetical protein
VGLSKATLSVYSACRVVTELVGSQKCECSRVSRFFRALTLDIYEQAIVGAPQKSSVLTEFDENKETN